jgi:hypothetical protein
VASFDRTRELVARHLGVALAVRVDEGYREADGSLLEGEWLGAFAQPAVILNTVSAMSVRLDEQGGASIDEYGEAALSHPLVRGDHVSWRKRYAGATFTYVGHRRDGVIAGYWYAPARPSFAGVFWLARADRLETDAAEALRARVRSTSPRRTLTKLAMVAILAAVLIGGHASWAIEVAGLGAGAAFVALLRARTRALQREAEAWRTEIGGSWER